MTIFDPSDLPEPDARTEDEIACLENQMAQLHQISREAADLVQELVQQHLHLSDPDHLQAAIIDAVDDTIYPHLQELETEIDSLMSLSRERG